LQYLSYVDVWLPEDAPVAATGRVAEQVEAAIRRVVDHYEQERVAEGHESTPVLRSLPTFVGGGGPRFWASAAPEQSQANYAQVLIEVFDKHDTDHVLGAVQSEVNQAITGARIDVRPLEIGPPVGIPVSIRVSGEDIGTLRRLASEVEEILRSARAAR